MRKRQHRPAAAATDRTPPATPAPGDRTDQNLADSKTIVGPAIAQTPSEPRRRIAVEPAVRRPSGPGPANEAGRTWKSGSPGSSRARQPGFREPGSPATSHADGTRRRAIRGDAPGQTMRANGKPAENRRNGHPYPPRSTGSRPGALGRGPVHDRQRSPPKANNLPTPGAETTSTTGVPTDPGPPASRAGGLSGDVSRWQTSGSLPPAKPAEDRLAGEPEPAAN